MYFRKCIEENEVYNKSKYLQQGMFMLCSVKKRKQLIVKNQHLKYKLIFIFQNPFFFLLLSSHNIKIMSLFIIGSVSRVTSRIVLQLARQRSYPSITIADLLPQYYFHHRFYNLQRQIDHLQLSQSLKLQKIHQINDLYEGSRNHDDVLYVTHDYYQHVTSKTKLMELTAEICKEKKSVVFATPVEYDHFGFSNPQNNYVQSQKKVRQLAPNATIIRSDVQDHAESMAYIHSKKNFIGEKIFNFYDSKYFHPKIVNTQEYAKNVVNHLVNKVQGKTVLIEGEREKAPFEVENDKRIEQFEFEHSKQNIRNMISKYKGMRREDYEKVVEASQ